MRNPTVGWLSEVSDRDGRRRGGRPPRAWTAARHVVGALMLLAGTVLSPAVAPLPSEAAGPWHGRVVDAETQQPVEGVVILAVWERQVYGHPAIGFGRTGHWGSDEVVTNAKGRFLMLPRILFDPGIGTGIVGPGLALFKAGYGGWRFQASRDSLTLEGAVIEMRPLRTREERVMYITAGETEVLQYGAVSPNRPTDEVLRSWRDAGGPGNFSDMPWQRGHATRPRSTRNACRSA